MFTDPSGSLLDLLCTAPTISIGRLAPPGTVLIVAPHPDDETFGCGAAIAAAAESGRQIAIVLLTDGEGSHPRSLAYPPERLKQLRLAELRLALEHLAGRQDIAIERLSLPDGCTAPTDLAYINWTKLERFAREQRTSVIWSTWKDDPHCDHETAAELATQLADRIRVPLWSFAVWGRFGVRNVDGMIPHLFNPEQYVEVKRRAATSYLSQTTDLIVDDPTGFRMPLGLVEHFITAPENFLEAR